MTHMSMIERVARAIAASDNHVWHDASPRTQEAYLASARAAVEAMRGPTERMVEIIALHPVQEGDCEESKALYDALIVEALRS